MSFVKLLNSPLSRFLFLGLLIAAASFGVQHIGFYADDYLFLDAARRMPASEVLLGQHGIYPWYRPLSRELLFYVALWLGPFARSLTLFISICTTGLSVWALCRIGRSLGSPVGGALGAVLYLSHDLTHLLTAWASGYQDLLGNCLTLLAVLAEVRSRSRLALVFAFCAPFAKETAFIALPLVVAANAWRLRSAPRPRLVTGALALALLAVLIHLLVRMSWVHAGSSLPINRDPQGLVRSLQLALKWFVSVPSSVQVADIWPALVGVIAFGGVTLDASYRAPTDTPLRRVIAIPILASALGLLPIVTGNLLRVSVVKPYYTFPALPWLALLVGVIAARALGARALVLAAALLALNTVGLAYRPPNLDTPSGWTEDTPHWREAIRISAATKRFARDLTDQLKHPPLGTVVLYSRLPVGSFFMQNADGATTRELLHDPTVRAYFLSEATPSLESDRIMILNFDIASGHLRYIPRSWEAVSVSGTQRLTVGEPISALTLFRYGQPGTTDELLEATYLRASAALCAFGPIAFRNATAIPLVDSTVSDKASLARVLAHDDPALSSAYTAILRSPLNAARRSELATLLFARGDFLAAGREARISSCLAAPSSREHFLIGASLAVSGAGPLARPELNAAVEADSPAEFAIRAGLLLNELEAAETQRPQP